MAFYFAKPASESGIDTIGAAMSGAAIHVRGCLGGLLALGACAIAQAIPQDPAEIATPATTPPSDPIAEIVVTGEKPLVETTVDRRIYTVTHDLHATSGSAADVLRNLPSISVDLDGNPSLRGDESVTILIDGRLAPEFNGSSRGAALQQLGAENIERVEVLTNPPVNFKRDGSGGIINIITRRRSGARTASVQASLGSNERYNLNGRYGVQLGKVNLRTSGGVRHEPRERDFRESRVSLDEDGTVIDQRQTNTAAEDRRLVKRVSVGADYDFTDTDRLTAEVGFRRRDADSFRQENALIADSPDEPGSEYTRTRRGDPYEYSSDVELRYHRDGERDGDGLTVKASRSEEQENEAFHFLKVFATPVQPDFTQDQVSLEKELAEEFGIDYVNTSSEDRKLIAGYKLSRDGYRFDNLQTLNVPAGDPMLPDPGFTNVFRYEQTIHALYGSYELPLDKWTWLAGVRLEDTRLDIHQVTTGERFSQDYFRAYPSVHVSRDLTENQTLRFSYTRRVSRPDGSDLNPFRTQINEFAVRQGNPNLEPSDYDSVEAGWSLEKSLASYSATAYARRSTNARSNITTLISPTVTLVTPQNIGKTLSGGVEFSASGRLHPKLEYNLSGNVYYVELDASNLGFDDARSTYSFDTKGALNWRLTDKDTVQINASLRGRRVTPQGYRPSNAMMDIGYRHQFRSNLSVTATVTDVFESRKWEFFTDTESLSQQSTFRPAGRILFVGVSWSMSGAKKPPEKFEYEE